MIEPVPKQTPPPVDMSPQAISERLDLVSELHELGKYLAQARPVDAEQNSPSQVDDTSD